MPPKLSRSRLNHNRERFNWELQHHLFASQGHNLRTADVAMCGARHPHCWSDGLYHPCTIGRMFPDSRRSEDCTGCAGITEPVLRAYLERPVGPPRVLNRLWMDVGHGAGILETLMVDEDPSMYGEFSDSQGEWNSVSDSEHSVEDGSSEGEMDSYGGGVAVWQS